MDDAIQILIYVLFIVVSIVGGIIKNNNKKKEEEAQRQKRRTISNSDIPPTAMPPMSGPENTVNPFEEFLRRQLEQYEEPEEEPIDVIPGYETPIDVIPAHETPIDIILPEGKPIEFTPGKSEFYKEGVSVFDTTSKEFSYDSILAEDFSSHSEIKDMEAFEYDEIKYGDLSELQEEVADFDASKAVIYSEILKRPVY
jgi:hypothetical protein